MTIMIKIPSPLRRFTDEESLVELEALHVNDALEQLFLTYPEIQSQIVDDNGELRNFVNLFYNRVDIRQLQGVNTILQEGSELRIVPAIAGGSDVSLNDSAVILLRTE